MELTVKDVLKMENIMNKVKDVVSNSVTITDHKSAGSIRLTECTMPEFEGFDICYLSDNKEETGSYIGSYDPRCNRHRFNLKKEKDYETTFLKCNT